MTTLAVPRSRRTSATAVYHAPVSNVLYDCPPGGKIQGYFVFVGRRRTVDSNFSLTVEKQRCQTPLFLTKGLHPGSFALSSR